jgi:hypothetical protein
MAKAFARVATFQGNGPESLDTAIKANRDQIEAGLASPPAGLEGVSGVWMLVDRESGTTIDLTLFETEDDLRRGNEALNGMSPAESEGRRTDVGLYEIAFRIEGS